MKRIKLLIFILITFLLTGCWNYNELNDLAIVTGISIDKDENGFVMNYMISNANKSDSQSNGNQASTVLYEGKGSTLSEAAENINQKLPKVPYLAHNEIIVISEEVAKEGLLNTMDFFLRNQEFRKEIPVLISKNTLAEDTLSIVTPLESFPSENIKSNLNASSTKTVSTSTIKYSEFLARLIESGIDSTLGVIEVEGNVKEGQSQESNQQSRQDAIIKLTDTAVFKKGKLVYMTNEQESTAINLINKKINSLYIKTKCDNESIVTNISSINNKINIDIVNNKPKISIKLSGEGSLLEVLCDKDIENENVIKEIKKQVDNEIVSLLNNGTNLIKKYNTDIFGFGNIIYKKNPKYWNTVKNKWYEEILSDLDINIESDIKISSKGSLQQSIKGEIK